MARILVTGGAGFIGGNFVHFWSNAKPIDEIIVLDRLTYAGNKAAIASVPQAELIIDDIRNTELVAELLRDRQIDTIVHFAAESHVDRSIREPDLFVETNILGTNSLLKAARRVWLDTGSGRPHRFHNVSTDEVYGSLSPDAPPFTETSSYAPNSPYSASKASADHLVRAYHKTYGLEITTSNCSNNYGPLQYPEKLIPLVIINALLGKPLPIFGDGLNVRDWLHVEDHCRGIAACLASGQPGESYNIGGGREIANIDVVDHICSEVDLAFESVEGLAERYPSSPAARGVSSSSLMTFVEDRLGHDRRYALCNTKAQQELGYVPAHCFEDGIAETLRWYIGNECWWRRLLAQPT